MLGINNKFNGVYNKLSKTLGAVADPPSSFIENPKPCGGLKTAPKVKSDNLLYTQFNGFIPY